LTYRTYEGFNTLVVIVSLQTFSGQPRVWVIKIISSENQIAKDLILQTESSIQ